MIRRAAAFIMVLTIVASVAAQHTGIYIVKGSHNVYVRETGVGYWHDASCLTCSGILALRFPFTWRNWIASPSMVLKPSPGCFIPWWLILIAETVLGVPVWRLTGTEAQRKGFPLAPLPII